MNICRCSSMVEHQPSKLDTWVRFPSPALYARVAQGWSTTLPRLGSRVRIPSRALFMQKRGGSVEVTLFCINRVRPVIRSLVVPSADSVGAAAPQRVPPALPYHLLVITESVLLRPVLRNRGRILLPLVLKDKYG